MLASLAVHVWVLSVGADLLPSKTFIFANPLFLRKEKPITTQQKNCAKKDGINVGTDSGNNVWLFAKMKDLDGNRFDSHTAGGIPNRFRLLQFSNPEIGN